ncbi:YjcQ family protein [Paraliobacillus sediminis]|uniref:YjcQ family protein n=1 Tax=Paraliobacillus sediminis TaxID=1885916 RepID=UPI000E3CC2DF|nr:YjcQ family protein [Paraliobacillus sediminis]
MSNKKMRLAVLKELEKGNKNFSHEDLEISADEFVKIFESLESEGLIREVDYYMGPSVDVNSVKLTIKGEEYLTDNSALMKTYKGLKEIRDWFKV